MNYMNVQKQARMQELVKLLNNASKAYYQDAEEIMSNYDYLSFLKLQGFSVDFWRGDYSLWVN